jgi:hypothetical protein
MKLTNLQILNPQFVPALEKILKKEIPLSTCEELAKIIMDIEDRFKLIEKVRSAMIDKYLEKDTKGQPVVINGNQPKYKTKEDEKKFLGELNELLIGEFEVVLTDKVNLSEDDKMSGQEYLLVKDFITVNKKPIVVTGGAVDISK